MKKQLLKNPGFLKSLTICIVSLLIISGCRAGDGEAPADFIPAKGFSISDEEPEGSPLVLPAGLTLESIEGYDHIDETDCNAEPRIGSPAETEVPLCLLFKNNNKQPVTLQLPPGLIFISKEIKLQNGIILQKISREISADQYLFVSIRAQYINTPRSFPGKGDKYRIGLVTQYHPMLDLIKKLETKNLKKSGNINKDAETGTSMQALVSTIAAKGKLDAYTKGVLDALPNKYNPV